MDDGVRHWSDDRYWTEALDDYLAAREVGRQQLVLDLHRIEAGILDGGSVAYRLMTAMASVLAHEGENGHRGAPRLLLAALHRLAERDGEQERHTP